jgi:hypothetical protein
MENNRKRGQDSSRAVAPEEEEDIKISVRLCRLVKLILKTKSWSEITSFA